MRAVEISPGVFAFEPEFPKDSIAAVELEHMRAMGISEAAVAVYKRYRDRCYVATPEGWVPRPFQAKVPTP